MVNIKSERVAADVERLKKEFVREDYEDYLTGKIKLAKLCDKYSVTHYVLLKYLAIDGRTSRKRLRKLTTIDDFFDSVDTELKAYLLGLFLADGCLTETHSGLYSINMTQTEKNRELVELFKDTLSPYTKISVSRSSVVKGTNYVSKPTFSVSFVSNHMAKTLASYGMGVRKTYNGPTNLDFIPEHLFIHFLRGYFDGDGTVHATNSSRIVNIKSGPKSYEYHNYNWSIISKCRVHLDIIQETLLHLYGVHANLIHDKKGCYLVEVNRKKDFFRLRELLYNNATYSLTSKKEKFMGIPC